jgi:hypothetical protein
MPLKERITGIPIYDPLMFPNLSDVCYLQIWLLSLANANRVFLIPQETDIPLHLGYFETSRVPAGSLLQELRNSHGWRHCLKQPPHMQVRET